MSSNKLVDKLADLLDGLDAILSIVTPDSNEPPCAGLHYVAAHLLNELETLIDEVRQARAE